MTGYYYDNKIINTICRMCSFVLNVRISLNNLSLFQRLSGHENVELQARCLEFGAAASAWPEGDCDRIQGEGSGHGGRLDNFIVVG